MPTATQLNLPIDNEIGTLARLCRDLADGGVNLLALDAPETDRDKGVIRLLVPNRDLAAVRCPRQATRSSRRKFCSSSSRTGLGLWRRPLKNWPRRGSASDTPTQRHPLAPERRRQSLRSPRRPAAGAAAPRMSCTPASRPIIQSSATLAGRRSAPTARQQYRPAICKGRRNGPSP